MDRLTENLAETLREVVAAAGRADVLRWNGAEEILEEAEALLEEYDEAAERRHDITQMHNDEFVAYLMNWSTGGPLSQLFVLDAIAKHAERIAKTPREEVEEAMRGHLIHGGSWYAIAVEINNLFNRRSE